MKRRFFLAGLLATPAAAALAPVLPAAAATAPAVAVAKTSGFTAAELALINDWIIERYMASGNTYTNRLAA